MGFNLPSTQFVPCVPSDTSDLDAYRFRLQLTSSLYVGATGDVACVDQSGTPTVFAGVPAGTLLPVAVRRVNASGTSATSLVACYWD